MKLLPLKAKKKLSKCLNWFRGGTITLTLAASWVVGLAGVIYAPHIAGGPGADKEYAELALKSDHLITTYRLSKSMDMVLQAGTKDSGFGLDMPKAGAKDGSLHKLFEAEAQATAIAIADAPDLSPFQRYEIYRKFNEIASKPAYFPTTENGDLGFMLFNHKRAEVMRRPGFKPTIAAAQEIASAPQHDGLFTLALMFGPMILTGAGAFAFCAARGQLDRSIAYEEAARLEAGRQAEAQRQAGEAARIAAEEAERRRIASLPPSVALDADIRVSKIKLYKPTAAVHPRS